MVKTKYQLDPNASYLISGGLGGLGRSIARWMATRGARHLILLSRSGLRAPAAQALANELGQLGVRVAAPPCDVSDADALKSALAQCADEGMPPIKGCVQAAMVLRVRDALSSRLRCEVDVVVLYVLLTPPHRTASSRT